MAATRAGAAAMYYNGQPGPCRAYIMHLARTDEIAGITVQSAVELARQYSVHCMAQPPRLDYTRFKNRLCGGTIARRLRRRHRNNDWRMGFFSIRIKPESGEAHGPAKHKEQSRGFRDGGTTETNSVRVRERCGPIELEWIEDCVRSIS
jgi:hypothetical protein